MKILFIICLMLTGLVASSQTGNVGIGTTAPLKPLHIVKGAGSGGVSTSQTSLLIESDATQYISLLVPTGQETGILHGRPGASIRGGIVFDLNSGIRFRAGGNATRMLLDSIGNFGVGIFTPQSRMHVANGALLNAQYLPNATAIFESNNTVTDGNILLVNPSGRDFSLVSATETSASRSNLTFGADSSFSIETGGTIPALKIDKTGAVTIPKNVGVNGRIKIGDDMQTPAEGSIRWNNTAKDFEGFTGTGWLSLTKAGVSVLGENGAGPVSGYKSIYPGDINEIKEFGFSVDIDTNYAIIGAIKNTTASAFRGAAYIFTKISGTWLQQAKLLPDAADNEGSFGYRVTISGEYAAVSDFVTNPDGVSFGKTAQVYIFKRTGTTWAKQTILNEVLSTMGNPKGTEFGNSIDMDTTHLVVGAPWHNSQTGAAFVYQRTGTTWSAPVSLSHQTTNIDPNPHFGTSVSLYNSEIIVGSPDEADVNPPLNNPTTPYGRVYLYRKQTGVWNNIFDIMPGSYGNNPINTNPLQTKFGTNISLYDRYMLVSAPYDGSVFFYANDGTGEMRFSYSNAKAVSIQPDKAAILSGNKVYIHKRTGSNWNLYAYYGDPENGIPVSAAIWGNEIIMGIPSFYKCAGVNCFNTGKATIATVE